MITIDDSVHGKVSGYLEEATLANITVPGVQNWLRKMSEIKAGNDKQNVAAKQQIYSQKVFWLLEQLARLLQSYHQTELDADLEQVATLVYILKQHFSIPVSDLPDILTGKKKSHGKTRNYIAHWPG